MEHPHALAIPALPARPRPVAAVRSVARSRSGTRWAPIILLLCTGGPLFCIIWILRAFTTVGPSHDVRNLRPVSPPPPVRMTVPPGSFERITAPTPVQPYDVESYIARQYGVPRSAVRVTPSVPPLVVPQYPNHYQYPGRVPSQPTSPAQRPSSPQPSPRTGR